MTEQKITQLATAIVVFTGALWGLYWLPVRSLGDAGLDGAWGTVAITTAAALLLSPAAILRRHQFKTTNRLALVSIALGGAAFALYSIGFVDGHVAIIILLYFLTPVWSSLIGRYVMGWHSRHLLALSSRSADVRDGVDRDGTNQPQACVGKTPSIRPVPFRAPHPEERRADFDVPLRGKGSTGKHPPASIWAGSRPSCPGSSRFARFLRRQLERCRISVYALQMKSTAMTQPTYGRGSAA